MNKLQNKNFITIIPARGGSKRLPAKNKLPLAGKPLIGWTIDAALQSTLRQGDKNEIIVSTDDKEIAKISVQAGAKVPFIRPPEFSTDTSSSLDVVKHAIDFYKKNSNMEFEFIVLLQPTSPLRDADDIDNAIKLLQDKNADAVVSVCEAEHSPLWCNTISPDLSMENFLKQEIKNIPGQQLPRYYRPNGAIYINRVKRLMDEKTFYFSNNIFAYIMDKEKSVDIDSLIDFQLAEILLKNK